MSQPQHIQPQTELIGNIRIPASKSHAQRVLALALINQNETRVEGLGDSDDEKAALDVLLKMGAIVQKNKNYVTIKGVSIADLQESKDIQFGESGLSSRMYTPILANSPKPLLLNGSGSLLARPMHFFEDAFQKLGVHFISNEGKLPFTLSGPLQPKSLDVDGSLSSQFITGLIYGYVASKDLQDCAITILNPTSIPYITLSLYTLNQFGVSLELINNRVSFQGPYTLSPAHIEIEGDWSSASFFLVAAALLGEITIPNLSMASCQADKAIIDALVEFGATVETTEGITVKKNLFQHFSFDATHCPDLFPPLAVLAAKGKSVSQIKGVHRLTHKESNRTNAIITEFQKMGVSIEIKEDTMLIHPCEKVIGATVDTHHDHRIAMATAILGLTADRPTTIENPNVVNKSFPSFYDLLNEYCKNIPTT